MYAIPLRAFAPQSYQPFGSSDPNETHKKLLTDFYEKLKKYGKGKLNFANQYYGSGFD